MWAALTSHSRSWSLVERLAFPAPKAEYDINSFPGELIMIPQSPAKDFRVETANSTILERESLEENAPSTIFLEKVPCVFLTSPFARFILICFHGNAEDLGSVYKFLCSLRDIFKVHVLAVEYPGYGIAGGTCSEASIKASARAAIYFASSTLDWPLDSILIFGRSLGTGPAMMLAAEYDVAGLILVAPFKSMREVLRNAVGTLADMAEDCFQNYELAAHIRIPTLIIHGIQDALVPISQGFWIYETLPGQKMMVCPDKMHHNSSLLDSLNMFVSPMTQFFSLPDYTFTEIRLPDWVLPEHLQRRESHEESIKKLKESRREPTLAELCQLAAKEAKKLTKTTKGPCGWTSRPVKLEPVPYKDDPVPMLGVQTI